MSRFTSKQYKLAGAAGLLLVLTGWASADDKKPPKPPAPPIEKYLQAGELTRGEEFLKQELEENPDDQQAMFSLGVVQFLRAVENVAQTQYKYGAMSHTPIDEVVPGLFPVPKNSKPEKITYQDARNMFVQFHNDLEAAERTLAKVDVNSGVTLPIHFGLIRLDLDGDGLATEAESLWKIYAAADRRVRRQAAAEFLIQFDGADVLWLRGYCHLLMALNDIILAYDTRELFERTAHQVFPNVETPHDYLNSEPKGDWSVWRDPRPWMDVVAFLHLINFKVEEPRRMEDARQHLFEVIKTSRQSWKLIQAEKDDVYEWLPNPKQTGVIPGVRVQQAQIDGWHLFLDEFEAILEGEKLLPFFRGMPAEELVGNVMQGKMGVGVNLKKAFTNPQDFDLVLWITGTGLTPFLEEGPMTQPDTWLRITDAFQGQFFGFAVWFN